MFKSKMNFYEFPFLTCLAASQATTKTCLAASTLDRREIRLADIDKDEKSIRSEMTYQKSRVSVYVYYFAKI